MNNLTDTFRFLKHLPSLQTEDLITIFMINIIFIFFIIHNLVREEYLKIQFYVSAALIVFISYSFYNEILPTSSLSIISPGSFDWFVFINNNSSDFFASPSSFICSHEINIGTGISFLYFFYIGLVTGPFSPFYRSSKTPEEHFKFTLALFYLLSIALSFFFTVITFSVFYNFTKECSYLGVFFECINEVVLDLYSTKDLGETLLPDFTPILLTLLFFSFFFKVLANYIHHKSITLHLAYLYHSDKPKFDYAAKMLVTDSGLGGIETLVTKPYRLIEFALLFLSLHFSTCIFLYTQDVDPIYFFLSAFPYYILLTVGFTLIFLVCYVICLIFFYISTKLTLVESEIKKDSFYSLRNPWYRKK